MATIEKQPLTSMNITEEQLQNFKQLFPEVFTEGLKVDWDKLRLTLGETVDTGKERYGMNWPGKADCFKTIQQPSIATLVPAREESIDFDTTENLFIEGDNLEVLKLLQKSYLGKVKMIYIDPPYNTGNEFIYPDNYSENLETYLEYTGQIDSSGKKFGTNTDTDGRFHSKWMNMMYPRLFLAKNLLKEDGVIFISINDAEVQNLRKICDEIYGEENFIAELVWSNKEGGGSSDSKYFRIKHEYILCYTKAKDSFSVKGTEISNRVRYNLSDEYVETRGQYYLQKLGMGSIQYSASLDYPIQTPDGSYITPIENNNGKKACWRWSKPKFEWGIENGFIVIKKDSKDVWTVYSKQYLNCDNEGKIIERTQRPFGVIDSFSSTQASKFMDSIKLGAFFDYSKPYELISYLISLSSGQNDIILDFFAGSATTAHAVMELNKEDGGSRKFICVQIPEPTEEKSEAYKAGYKSIAEVSKERIRRVAVKIKTETEAAKAKKSGQLNFDNQENQENQAKQSSDLGFKVFKLDHSNFKIWDATLEKEPEAIQQRLFEHIDHISPEAAQESILYELLLKSGFELTTPIEKLTLADKIVFSIAGGQLLICLEKELTNDAIKAMAEMQPTRVICLDEAFKGANADALKTNAVQIMKSKGVVNFRTV